MKIKRKRDPHEGRERAAIAPRKTTEDMRLENIDWSRSVNQTVTVQRSKSACEAGLQLLRQGALAHVILFSSFRNACLAKEFNDKAVELGLDPFVTLEYI